MKRTTQSLGILLCGSALLFASGCTIYMRKGAIQPNTIVLEKKDYDMSDPKTAKGVAKMFLMFSTGENDKMGGVAVYGEGPFVPPGGCCMGAIDPTGQARNIALYNLLEQNPGYDAVLNPQYKVEVNKPCGMPIISTTTVTVTARLIKYKN